MKLVAVTSLCALALCGPAWGDDCPPEKRTISVSGHGEVDIEPDVALVSLAVETVHERADAAVSENAERSDRVVQAIKQHLGDGDRVSTTGFSLQPRYEHRDGSPEPRITGYVASNSVRVETKRTDGIGKIVDAAIRVGANRVDQLEFTAENPEPARLEALSRAGKHAKAQAASIAAALGVGLGKVQSVSSSGPMPVYAKHYDGMARMAMAEAVPATPIEAGQVRVSADVSVVYEID